MKVYLGRNERTARGGFVVTVVDPKRGPRPLAPRNDLINHSPNGFAWGYGGSGPAQLALALAADVLGDDKAALRVYQDLKWDLIAKLPAEWELTTHEITEALRAIIRGKP